MINDIQHFDELAQEWWNPQGKLWTLHKVNPSRMQFILRHQSLKNSAVLDVGCGGGVLSEAMALAGADVTAIDLSKESVKVAREHAKSQDLSVNYLCQSADSMALDGENKFDVVTCMELLEHVEEPHSMIQSMANCIKPGGSLFVSTLNRNLKSWFLSIIVAEKMLKWLPKGTHNHGRYLKPSEVASIARAQGLDLQHSIGIFWNPLKADFCLSESDLDVNYILCFRKPAD